jgi:hypothetical protein
MNNDYEQRHKERVVKNMKAKAKQIGYSITLEPLADSAGS